MREVMLDMVNLRPERLTGKGRTQRGFHRSGFADVTHALQDKAGVRTFRQDKQQAADIVNTRIAIDGDVIHIAKIDPGFAQTIRDGFRRQASSMFDAPEALFFGGGNQGAVAHQTRRGITMVGVNP